MLKLLRMLVGGGFEHKDFKKLAVGRSSIKHGGTSTLYNFMALLAL